MRKVELSPSILSADLSKIDKELELVRQSPAKYIHLDIMDGKFVPKERLSAKEISPITKISKLVNDVHIMIEKPIEHVLDFINNGADILTFHYEACKDDDEVYKTIKLIKSKNCKAGLSIKPNTNVDEILKFLPSLDLILVMSVEPGYGGQKYISSSTDKIRKLRECIDSNNLTTLIEVDGGINYETSKEAKNAGVDIIVAGSYLFGHEDFISRAIELVK